jgi:hypothetical protein
MTVLLEEAQIGNKITRRPALVSAAAVDLARWKTIIDSIGYGATQ